jgi:hypothetical protein
MSPWVLLIILVNTAGTTSQVIDMPSQAACQRVRQQIQSSAVGTRVDRAVCLSREER